MTGFRICKTFRFDASHRLDTLPPGHKCARLHGHTYRVEATVYSPITDQHGFVVDFAELTPLGAYIGDVLDHRHLNGVLDIPPTSENLARHLFDWCRSNLPMPVHAHVEAIRVSETPSTWAEYSGAASDG